MKKAYNAFEDRKGKWIMHCMLTNEDIKPSYEAKVAHNALLAKACRDRHKAMDSAKDVCVLSESDDNCESNEVL